MELFSALGLDLKILAAQVVNFLVLGFILYKIGYKPILRFVQDRTDKIEQGVKQAEQAKTILSDAQTEQTRLLAEAKVEAQKVLDEAKAASLLQGQQLIDRSKLESAKVVEKAKQDIRLEHDKMMQDAKAELAGVILLTCEKVLKSKLDTSADRALIEKTLAELN